MFIEIIKLYDSCDCETCGYSYAEGYLVKFDGKVVIDLSPKASCFGGDNYTEDDLLQATLTHLGHQVFITDGSDDYE